VIDPATYLLLEGNVIVIPNNPGATAIYPQRAAPTQVKMIDTTFPCNKNYFLSYKIIARAYFCIFDADIAAQFKVSNTPTLTGWNLTMFINKILDKHTINMSSLGHIARFLFIGRNKILLRNH
jgi:hypothetical protein